MGRNVTLIFKLFFLAILSPLLFYITDQFVNPVGGILVTMGASEAELAIVGAVPWVVPVGFFVWFIIDFGKKDEPKYPGGFNR